MESILTLENKKDLIRSLVCELGYECLNVQKSIGKEYDLTEGEINLERVKKAFNRELLLDSMSIQLFDAVILELATTLTHFRTLKATRLLLVEELVDVVERSIDFVNKL